MRNTEDTGSTSIFNLKLPMMAGTFKLNASQYGHCVRPAGESESLASEHESEVRLARAGAAQAAAPATQAATAVTPASPPPASVRQRRSASHGDAAQSQAVPIKMQFSRY